MTDITETQSSKSESKLSLSKNDLIYCFAIILLMLTVFDLMGKFISLGLVFIRSNGFTIYEADYTIWELFFNLVIQTGVVLSFIFLYRLRKIEPEERTSPKGLHILTTYSLHALNLTFGLIVFILLEPLLIGFGLTTESPYDGIAPTLALLQNPLFVPLFLAVLVIGASISEELVFRRSLIPMLERRGLGQAWVLIISSLVFSLRHTPADYLSGSLGFTIVHFFGTMSGGLILGYLYLRTRNILWPILLHALTNGVAAVAQISLAVYNDGLGDSTLFLISVFWGLIAIGFGFIVLSYLVIQFVTKRHDTGKPVWLQIITDVKIKTVKLRDILILTVVFIFFSGGIHFVFAIVESVLLSVVIVDESLVNLSMVLIETTYYLIFIVALSIFVFKKAQPMAKPIFVPTVISGESKYSSTSAFVRRPVYQPNSGKFCKSCGNAIIPNAKFCAFCGVQHSLDEEDPNHEF